MKTIYLAVATLRFSVTSAQAASVYGQLWAQSTEKQMSFTQAVIGAKAGLGGDAKADMAYDAKGNALYTAAVSFGILGSDSLSVGLQSSVMDKWLDSTLGQSALNCFGCAHSKSAQYTVNLDGGALALTGNEGNNYSAAAKISLLKGLAVLGSATYDNPSAKWSGRGGVQLSSGAFALVADGTHANDEGEYGVAGSAALGSGFGVFGKIRKSGALLVGPTYDAAEKVQLAMGVGRDAAGADYHTDVRLSANF